MISDATWAAIEFLERTNIEIVLSCMPQAGMDRPVLMPDDHLWRLSN
jgi:hypothetical protein